MHDMLGLNNSFSPRFLRRYANLHEESLNAIRNYVADVKSCDFPNEKEAY
jgi:3-methyl-2-oxobutanoate hydroxymethyltransferase